MRCERCEAVLAGEVPGWCSTCGQLHRVDGPTLLTWLVPGWVAVDADPPAMDDPLDWPGYDGLRAEIADATGLDESVVAGRGPLGGDGPEVIVVAWSFAYLGGSMGQAAGERIAAAYDEARAGGLPIVIAPSTGGARMHEGMASLAQLAVTTVAQLAHGEAGLLQVAVLRDPTTGGVFASHANLADVVLAERGATMGFAGPRVSEAMTGGPLPSGSHTALGARAAGLVDEVVDRPDLPEVLRGLLTWSTTHGHESASATTTEGADASVDRGRAASDPDGASTRPRGRDDAWASVERSRATDRDRSPAFLAHEEVVVHGRLSGDRGGGVDAAIEVVLARWDGRTVVVLAMDPGRGAIGPAGYRTARRGLALADRLGVPVVTLVDTPGADASASGEAGGIAYEIATTLGAVLTGSTPIVALVVGEGGSGGALALAVGDRLLVQEHATFHVIAPEGAAAILHRDRDRAPEVARLLDPTATRLHALGLADEVVPEPPGGEVVTAIEAVSRHLDELAAVDPATLVEARRARWRAPVRAPRPTAEDRRYGASP